MDGLSSKNFSGGSVFPDNKAFRKLCFARCLKNSSLFWLHCLIRNFWKFAKNGRKKAANLFRIYCFMCRCGAAGYSVFMLSVKPELEQAFNQLCSDVVLHIRIIIAVHFGEIADIPGISVKDSLYRYGVALMCFYYRVIGEKSVTHGTTPPFLLSAASR